MRGLPGILWVAFLLVLVAGCRQPPAEDVLVVTQTRGEADPRFVPVDILDLRYPPESRLVMVSPSTERPKVRVLSQGLLAAGGPVVAPEGDRILFVAKVTAGSPWQIYESTTTGGRPVQRTFTPKGAMDPAYLPGGGFVFSSPVPRVGEDLAGPDRPQLYAQRGNEDEPTPLTFGLAGASDATLLHDGRILFVSGGSPYLPVTNQGLYTINTDGTEISAYGGQHDGRGRIRRPRETHDGRVLFLSSDLQALGAEGRIEQMLTARPFSSRSVFTAGGGQRFRAIEPGWDGGFLVTAPVGDEAASYAVYAAGSGVGRLVFDDPHWHEVEAVPIQPRQRPMGHLSNVDENHETGLILCLNANDTGDPEVEAAAMARRVRFSIRTPEGGLEWLGEVPLQADGSFLAEVPANRLLGMETVDDAGRVLHRLAPVIWVRPGENRACLGCHERHGTCPENRRPLAVKQPAVKLEYPASGLVQASSAP